MMLQVVVTGSTGHIGGALARQLVANGFGVRGLDRRPGRWTEVVGDLASVALNPVLDGCDVVVHCASLHAPHVDHADRSEFTVGNVVATARLLEAAQRAGVSKFVFTSTTSVYGYALEDHDQAVWVDETLQPAPRDIYDSTKLEAESLVSAHHSMALGTMTLRIARCFPEPWRTTVVNRLYRGVDLRDVVSAIELGVTASIAHHVTLNIAGPRVFERSDADLLRTDPGPAIAARVPWLPAEFTRRGWYLPSSIDRVYVSDNAAAVLGYRPKHGVRDALAIELAAGVRGDLPMAC